jgi:hypothetical protein
MKIRQVSILLASVFVIALAVVVAKQMSTEAMAVVVGIVCGVAAGIPTSLLLVVSLTRRDRRRLDELEQQARRGRRYGDPLRDSPPVVVIQGGTPQALPPGSRGGYWPAANPAPPLRREFHVVGGDDLVADDRDYWRD